jgi:DNA-binding CsgD family transcriptional regulator
MAGAWSKFRPEVAMLFYDSRFRILWISWENGEIGDITGSYSWEHCSFYEVSALQAAFTQCISMQSEVPLDADFNQYGRWRCIFAPCSYGEIRVVARCRRWPEDVQRLTDREAAVCYWLGCGLPTKQIASLLSVSRSTVFNLRSSAARRLNISADELCAWSGARLEWLEGQGTAAGRRSPKR